MSQPAQLPIVHCPLSIFAQLHQPFRIIVNRQNQQTRCRAKHRAGNTMVTAPTAIIILYAYHTARHIIIIRVVGND